MLTAVALLLASHVYAAEEEEQWDVNALPGESRSIPIDTSSGNFTL